MNKIFLHDYDTEKGDYFYNSIAFERKAATKMYEESLVMGSSLILGQITIVNQMN